jgi:hypothetical protein
LDTGVDTLGRPSCKARPVHTLALSPLKLVETAINTDE